MMPAREGKAPVSALHPKGVEGPDLPWEEDGRAEDIHAARAAQRQQSAQSLNNKDDKNE